MSECGEYTAAGAFCRLSGVFDGRCRVHRVLPTAGGREAARLVAKFNSDNGADVPWCADCGERYGASDGTEDMLCVWCAAERLERYDDNE